MSPQLNIAPSPSPAIAAQPSPGPAASASAPGRENAPDPAAGAEAAENQPFAAVLQKQMKQHADNRPAANTKQAQDALLDLQAAADLPAQEEQLPTDELAALLPMLPAMAAQAAGAGEETTGEDAAKADPALAAGDAGQAVVVTAAPVTPVVVQQAAAAPVEGEVRDGPAVAEAAKPATPSAILAADTAATDEVAAGGAKKATGQESFESLLAQVRDLPNAHRPQHNEVKSADTAARVQSQVGTPAWNTEIGDRLTWMAGNKETKAELVLTPPQMGRIEISLTLNGDQANASFVSANPAVREALESALPRLREILNEAGISLGQTQVGAESFQQSANNGQNGDNASRGQNGAGRSTTADTAGGGFVAASPRQWLQRGNGLVDLFA